jgi:hypothetical protein
MLRARGVQKALGLAFALSMTIRDGLETRMV